jgi:TPR repeat protein
MRRFNFLPFVFTLALVVFAALAYAGFDDGKAAYVIGDYATAYKELKPLADQGNVEAQCMLGRMYEFGGHGVRKDHAQALKWFRKAAEQGDPGGQYDMGMVFTAGHGVPQDYVQAYMWFNLAALQGNLDARNRRDEVARKITPAQIAEAQRLAKEWKPKGKD